MESFGFRKLGDLQLEHPYRITVAEKITTQFREKVRLELESLGRVLLPEIFNRTVTQEVLRELNKRESSLLWETTSIGAGTFTER